QEVCMLLEEVVASRIKHYLEAPKQRVQGKSVEHTPSCPLFLTASRFHISACFMRRWVNLRCALGKQYHELRVFPERFSVCVSKLEPDPSSWTGENGVLKELSSGTSEYFTESAENEKLKISLNEQTKQDILKEIVKRTKPRQRSTSKPQISKGSKKVYLGSGNLQMGNRKNDCQSSPSPPSEVKCRSVELLQDCINTAESSLELPVLELENDVNQRQADDVSSQQKPHSVAWLQSRLLSEQSVCSSESALLGPQQTQTANKTQPPQQSCGSEEKLKCFKQGSSAGTSLVAGNTERGECHDDCSGPFPEEKTPLNSRLVSEQSMPKATSDGEALALRKALSQPLPGRNNTVQTSHAEPSRTAEELPGMPSACPELQPGSSERLVQKRKKEAENGLRKLKLRRLKKP
ncbi:SLX4I protein, partial [Alcedo cyanopectus]|nr:SLX4I protein [Ceyx cyanopectus]